MKTSEGERIIPTPSAFAREHYLFVQEVGFLKSLVPHISRRQNLDSYLLFFVLTGQGHFYYNQTEYTLKQGDCVWIDCHLPYSHESSKTSPWELKWVHFSGAEAAHFYELFQSTDLYPVFTPANPGLFNETLSQLFASHRTAAAGTELLSHRLLTDMVTDCLLSDTQNRSKSSDLQTKLSEIRDYLRRHFSEELTLDDLSSRFFISRYHLVREYHRLFGITPVNDLTAIRISEAKSRLRFTDASIATIASACGYPDANYFTRVFRKCEGITPLAYRKLW